MGGNGGSFASPKAGGSFLPLSDPTVPTLDALVIDAACSDSPETAELYEVIEELEPRRVNCVFVFGKSPVDAFRGGSAG